MRAPGPSSSKSREKTERDANIKGAIATLVQAVGDNFKDAHVLLSDPDFAPLRENVLFKELIADIKKR